MEWGRDRGLRDELQINNYSASLRYAEQANYRVILIGAKNPFAGERNCNKK